jgi:hypothetical protein
MRIRRTMTKTEGMTMATIVVPPFTEDFESSSLAIKKIERQESVRYIEAGDLNISRMTCTTIESRLNALRLMQKLCFAVVGESHAVF